MLLEPGYIVLNPSPVYRKYRIQFEHQLMAYCVRSGRLKCNKEQKYKKKWKNRTTSDTHEAEKKRKNRDDNRPLYFR